MLLVGWTIAWFVSLVLTPIVARTKHRSGLAWFLLALLLGILATILVALIPPGVDPRLRPCPRCAELIEPKANKCRYCASDIEPLAVIPRW